MVIPIEGAAALSAAMPQGSSAALGSRTSTDNELDIVRLIQERDAYKLETDNLRKIIDRQRFIIQSLQEQISRKQSSSPASTPAGQGPEAPLEPSEPYDSSGDSFTAAAPGAGAPDGSKVDTGSSVNAASNSLGLSALSTAAQPKSSPAIRKISQGSATAGSPLQPDGRDPADLPAGQANARLWAKSTRLSEIYADYSARHNSVSPMFKSSAAVAAADLTGGEGDKAQRVPSSGGSSFVESLKSSIQRTEWPNEWGSPGGHGYGSDNNPDRRISSLVLDSSRDRSRSMETEGAGSSNSGSQQLRSSSAWSTKSAADSLDVDFTLSNNMPAETTKGAAQIVKQRSDLSARSAGEGPQISVGDLAGPSNTGIGGISAMAVPAEAVQSHAAAKSAAQTAQELLVMRPISTLPSRAEQAQLDKTITEDASTQKDIGWRASQISQYEYGDLFDKQPVQVPTDAISSQQQSQQRQQQQQQQPNKTADVGSPSFGPAPDAEPKVKWALDNGSSSKNTRSDLNATAFGDARSLPTKGPQSAKELQDIPEAAAINVRNNTDLSFTSPSSETGVHYEPSVISMPQGLTPSHSYASTSKYQPQPNSQLSSLQDIDIWIKDSRVKIDERGKEVNVYMVDIVRRKEISGMSLQEILIESQQSSIVLWTVEKRYSDFLNLNTKLRQVISKERLADKLEKLPDKDIFRPNAPTKSDKRKVWFEKYLKKALILPISDKQPLLDFLSTDRTMEPEKNMPILLGHKEGFLVKKGKNFGGWKRRYYTCKSNKPLLEYFESPGGSVIGSINLSGAVVKMGKNRENEAPTSRSKGSQKGNDMFRHAFLIEERPKRAGKEPVSHPLWADSDRERDEWVMALRYVIVLDSDGPERAMRDVVKYLNYTNNKDPNMLMLHQIHTSITHEQGARRSIEHSRLKEEQRISAASVDASDGRSFEMRRPSNAPNAQPPGGSSSGNNNNKFGSPLSRQMWPVAASMDNLGYTGRIASNSATRAPTGAEPRSLNHPGVPNSNQEHLDQHALQDKNRHRSVSYPPSPAAEPELPDSQKREAGFKARASPTVIAATLSTSFSGCNDDSLSSQADRISVHYVPSEISTIESSIYSTYNGAENSHRANGVSSQSIDEQNSYASMPESPVSPRKNVETEPLPAGRAREKSPSNPTPTQHEQKSKGHSLVHADSTPQLQTHGPASVSPGMFGDAGVQMAQAVAGMSRSQFTKNSLGRIVHEEEYAPELPSNTPRVTDDILGVGRQESASPSNAVRDGSNGRTRTREEKKRGRITFMWGKRKPVENEPALPDNPAVGSGSNASNKGISGGSGVDSSPPVSAPRRLRRGSMHGDNRFASGKGSALKEPVFGLPLERAVKLTKIKEHYHLPAVVYRCIEFLDAKKAWLEEGIYRQSGSSLALTTLRKEFNSSSDYNLLKLSKPPDIHAVASLLKAYLRELPESVLTLRLHQEFMRVVDLADRGDRVHELGRLVSELPIANYTLLRALTAHLIRIVQEANTNRMTLRNIGIVFSPSLGIPVSVFSLLMVEFEYIFWVNDSGIPEPKSLFVDAPSTVAGSTSAITRNPEAHLSVSVPSGLNRAHDDDTLYSAGSQTAADSVSFASDVPVHPPRITNEKKSASSLRPGGHIRPGISSQRSQDGVRGATAAAAEMSDGAWDPHMDSEFLVSPGNIVGNDLSRYPGLPASTHGKQQQQQQQQQQQHQRVGRSNRNSIQYNVGAPRELISQEAEMTMPRVINESDDSDDFDPDSDDFSGGDNATNPATIKNYSSLVPQSISSRNASSQH
ncbi:Rho GTPase activating protein [Coemansia sp. RSA 1843]|nr:Rho GTPase activating protein [Coemansia sp. RSA 1843]